MKNQKCGKSKIRTYTYIDRITKYLILDVQIRLLLAVFVFEFLAT